MSNLANSAAAAAGSGNSSSLESVGLFEDYLAKKNQKLAAEGRLIEGVRYSPKLAIYRSKGDPDLDINGVFSDQEGNKIRCRHLAYEYLALDAQGSDPHESFGEEGKIESLPRLKENFFDREKISSRADAYYLVPTESPQGLGQTLETIYSNLDVGQKKSILLNSENHAMSLVVRKKVSEDGVGYYSIKFFDPNNAGVHRRVVAQELKSLANLDFDSLMSSGDKNWYFPTTKVAVLSVYNDPLAPSPVNTERRFTELPTLKTAAQESPGFLNLSCEFGFKEQVQEFLESMEGRSKQDKMNVLGFKNENEKCAFGFALLSENVELVKSMMEFVARQSDFSSEDKKAFVAGKVTGTHDALFVVLQEGLLEMFQSYVGTLKESFPQLISTSEERLRILDPRDSSDGQSGLAVALAYKESPEMIRTYLSLISADDVLSIDHKFQILLAKMDDGKAGLKFAFEENHPQSMRAYVQSLPGFSGLTEAQKIQLLEARGPDINGVPGSLGLNEALKSGKLDVVRAYASEVLALPEDFLSLDKKLKLICPAFASQLLEISGRQSPEVFRAFVEGICTQNTQEQFKALLNLGHRDFHGCNLSGCNLSGCNLWGCNFVGANLEGVKFDAHTVLTKAIFTNEAQPVAKLDLVSINALLTNKTSSECRFVTSEVMKNFIAEYKADRGFGLFRSANFAKSIESIPDMGMASLVLMQHYYAQQEVGKSEARTVKIFDKVAKGRNDAETPSV
jgi:hypothetical protein